MKYILSEKDLEIPENIEIEVKSRVIEVKGPLGKLRRSFKHVPFDMRKIKDEKSKKNRIIFQMWNQRRKQAAVLGSVRGTISNMIRGVTTGYKFKMVLAYAHFPIIANVLDGGKALEVKNFVGIKMNKRVNALPGVTISKKEEEKNIITVVGTDLDNVSQTCALIHQSTKVPNKDLRQFLDGIYVQEARLDMK